MAAVAATAIKVYKRLKELGCPALESVYLTEAKEIEKLLCTPSSHRLDILEWICVSVYPPFRKQLSSLKESQSDMKIKEMTILGYHLMLCRADDLDLIKGKACAQKQLSFLEQLLAVIPPPGNIMLTDSLSNSSSLSSVLLKLCGRTAQYRAPWSSVTRKSAMTYDVIAEHLEVPLRSYGRTPHSSVKNLLYLPRSGNKTVGYCICTEESFQEIARKNEEFVKQIFSSSYLQAVLKPECHPWSADIKPLLLSEEAVQKRALPSTTSHEKMLLELSKELEEMAATLQDLRAECSFLHGDPAGADSLPDSATVLQTLKLVVSDFNQLLVTFEQVYENELQKYCGRPAPRLSPCGPLFQTVYRSLVLCMQELQGLAQVTETSECIMKMVKWRHGEKVAWSGSSTQATLPSKLEELRQKYETIHATLQVLPVTLSCSGLQL